MGACTSRDDVSPPPSGDGLHTGYGSRGGAGAHATGGGGGQRLGGGASEASGGISPGAAAAAAAEARATKSSSAPGVSAERRRRDELIGRMQELYRRRGQEPPMGLPTMTLKRLEELHASMRVQV